MPQYSFESLSGYEFERVVRDLLQEDLGIPFQSGPPGKDGGIDLRSAPGGNVVLAQCKQYARSGVATLLRRLERDEVRKVHALAPARYLLVTSLPLTHEVRRKIAVLFAPFCQSEHDVLGSEDLEQLLLRHPVVADRHIKLWLTSEPVLRRILLARIYDDSELEMDRVRRQLARYVVNPSLNRAREILEREHVCVIAGLPGIGKTTLAQVLMTRYEANGYQVIRIPNYLSQVLGAARREAKTIFYFDDFLGQTVLERRERNEDQRLAEFIESVRHQPNWRFVLTTREYILEQARLSSEALSRLALQERTCVITLDKDYTPKLRARILYQHLCFSDLPESHTLALLASGHLPRILHHRNYSPRLIGLLTSKDHTRPGLPADYAREFLETFNNPERLWEVAFRAMHPSVQDMALVMGSLPSTVRLSHLLQAYEAFRARRASRLNATRRSGEAQEAIRVLDGTMLQTKQSGTEIVVEFHNPSVRDFLQGRFRRHDDDVTDLIASAEFLDQCVALFQGDGKAPYPAVVSRPDVFVEAISRTLGSESTHFVEDEFRWIAMHFGGYLGDSPESTALFIFDVARLLGTAPANALLDRQLSLVGATARVAGATNTSDAATLIRHVYVEHARSLTDDTVIVNNETTALAALLMDRIIEGVAESQDETDMLTMTGLLADLPELRSPGRLADAKAAVMTYGEYMEEAIMIPETADVFRAAAKAVEKAAMQLGLEVESLVQSLRDRADRIEETGEDELEPDTDDEDYRAPSTDTNGLFQRLEGELRSRTD